MYPLALALVKTSSLAISRWKLSTKSLAKGTVVNRSFVKLTGVLLIGLIKPPAICCPELPRCSF